MPLTDRVALADGLKSPPGAVQNSELNEVCSQVASPGAACSDSFLVRRVGRSGAPVIERAMQRNIACSEIRHA